MTDDEFNAKMSHLLEQEMFEEIPALKKKFEDSFWLEEYPKKNRDEKVKYWSGNFHNQMRISEDSGGDELDAFSTEDFIFWKSKEPELVELLPEILSVLNISVEKVYPILGLKF